MLEYFAIASIATLLTHAYFALRLLAPLRPRSRARRIVVAVLVANVLVLPGTLVATLQAPASVAAWSVPIAHVAFADVGLCIVFAFGLLLRDVVWFAARAAGRLGVRTAIDDPSRRAAMLGGLNVAVGAVAIGSTAVGYADALAEPVLRRVRISVPNLAGASRPFRVVQVSDLHVGPTIRRDYVEALVRSVNALDADAVVLTGDLVDGFVAQLREQVEPLGRLRARHGVFVVTGNHEFFYGASDWIAMWRAMGLHVLDDEHHVIDHDGRRIAIIGVNDEEKGGSHADRRATIAHARGVRTDRDVEVLLAHRPSDAEHAAALGVDVQLSGHIHAGQFVPLAWLVRRVEPYFAGLYSVRHMQLYVNRGAGYWGPPNRLGAQQEITLMELTASA